LYPVGIFQQNLCRFFVTVLIPIYTDAHQNSNETVLNASKKSASKMADSLRPGGKIRVAMVKEPTRAEMDNIF
jgi:hypothetical protein